MTFPKYLYSTALFIALALAFLAISLTGCTEGKPYGTVEASDGRPECDDLVILRVEEVDITLADLFADPQFYQFIEERLVKPEIIRQEAARRGVVPDQNEVRRQIDDLLVMQGGYDQFMNNLDPKMPRELLDDDLRRFFTQQVLTEDLAEDRYDELFGVPTEQQIRDEWQRDPDLYRILTSRDSDYEQDEITFEIAYDTIVGQIKYEWVQQNVVAFVADFSEDYNVQNFLRERIAEMDLPVVPLVDQSSFELEEVEDHDAHEGEHQEEGEAAEDHESDGSASDAGDEGGE